MHPRQPIPDRLRTLAAYQEQVVSREQILGCGLSRHALARLVREQTWRSVAPRIVATSPEPTGWAGWVWAAILTGGDGARVAGLAAAHLHRLTDTPPGLIEILVPDGRWTPTGQPDGPVRWRFTRERAWIRQPSVGEPSRITVEDAMLDLAAAGDAKDVMHWVSVAVQRRRTTPRRLRTALDQRRSLRNRKLITELLGDVAVGAETPLELRYLRDVERAHGLPTAGRQLRRGSGIVDIGYDDYGLVIELDGRLGHEGEARFRDMARDRASLRVGLSTLRFGWSDVAGTPCGTAAEVAHHLRRRGWSGEPDRCSRCSRGGSGREYAA